MIFFTAYNVYVQKNIDCNMNKFLIYLLCVSFFSNCKPGNKINKKIAVNNIPMEMLGNFQDDYGIRYTISDTTWIQQATIKYHLLKYDSVGQFFIARNAATNPSEPGLYTRIDVMHFTNMEPWHWGFCLTTYNAKTIDEAIAKQVADRTNPKKGCGGYPFSRMEKG